MKPHKGRIVFVKEQVFSDGRKIIWGFFVDHPEFAGKLGHTSQIIKSEEDQPRHSKDGYEVETLNSRYTIMPANSVPADFYFSVRNSRTVTRVP